jgi:hypothetical protein
VSPTPPKPKDNLELVAARLSRAAPNAWSDFVAAFEAFTRDRESACVQAPSDQVLLAQGMARQCIELRTLLNDASKQK